ncbi:MAG: hypothetical protein ACR2F1_07890 [Nitrososphaeraceae archaeon]
MGGFTITKEKQEVSKDTLERLSTIENDINESKVDDKYVKFEDGQKTVFQFIPDQSKIIFKKWNGKQYEEFEYQKDDNFRKYYRFAVYDPNLDKERVWDVSNFKAVQTIIDFLKQGIFFLKIKRIGTEKNTIYDIEAGAGE